MTSRDTPVGLRLVAVAGLIHAVCTVSLAAAPAQGEPDSQDLFRTTLTNGLEVLVAENHAVPLATVLVAVRTGAFTQQPGEQGLSHLFEHVLFRAYGGRPTDFGRDANDLQASYNGTTSVDVVTYYLIAPSENAEKAIRLLGRLFTRARFRQNDLKDELPIVLDELARTEADPEGAFRRRVNRQLWADDWHRRDVIGDSTALASITLDQVNAAFRHHYVPNNAVLIVSGDVTAALVTEAAEEHFGEWEAGPSAPVDSASYVTLSTLPGVRAVVMRGVVLDVTIRIGIRGPGLRVDPASVYAASALMSILNDPLSAVQERLVRGGPFQSLAFSYRPTASASPIIVEGITTDTQAEEAMILLVDALDQIELLLDVPPDELAMADRRRRVDRALAMERTATMAPALASWWAGPGIELMETYSERVGRNTVDDLKQVAGQYIAGVPKVIGVLGPPVTIDRILRGLQREQP